MVQGSTKSKLQMFTTRAEDHLLSLSCAGVKVPRNAGSDDMRELVEGLRAGKTLLYFPYYWNHRDVRRFLHCFHGKLSADHILRYMSDLTKMRGDREIRDLYWMERVNLFHFYGLLRILGRENRESVVRFIEKQERIRSNRLRAKHSERSLIDVSSYNALAVVQERDIADMTPILDMFGSHGAVLPCYGKYQMYYYGGISECISQLAADLEKSSRVAVPHSALALLLILEELDLFDKGNVHQRIMEELVARFPGNVREKIEFYSEKRRGFSKT